MDATKARGTAPSGSKAPAKAAATSKSKDRPRRKQADRIVETTRKLVEATIQVVNQVGYGAVRTTHITSRSGVSWGAVQHIFGNKENLLLATANTAVESLDAALLTDLDASAPISDRLKRLIDLTWAAYSTPAYVAQVEILRGSRHDEKLHGLIVERQTAFAEKLRARWHAAFAGDAVSKRQIDDTRNLVTLTLSGFASRRIFLHVEGEDERVLGALHMAALAILQSKGEPAAD